MNKNIVNNNLIKWHCDNICDYTKYLHSYIEKLEDNVYMLDVDLQKLVVLQSSQDLELLTSNNRILELEAELKIANEIISATTGKLREFVSEKFSPSSEKSRYQKKKEEKSEISVKNETQENNIIEPIILLKERKKRGANKGHKGHGRKIPKNLPIEEVIIEIDGEEPHCSNCNSNYRRSSKTIDSCKINIKIILEKIIYKRVVYVKDCNCSETSTFLTAPKPAGIIPKSLYTNQFWSLLLVFKYFFQIPINRQMNIFDMYHYKPTASTIIGGFKKLLVLLIPLYDKFKEEILKDNHWHCDETRWMVFEEKDDKKTHLWWLWTFVSMRLTVFVLDPTRSSNVPKNFFGEEAKGIVNVDRYAAYNILKGNILLAYCWYHLRRDFLKAQISFPYLTQWAGEWLQYISRTEELNTKRLMYAINSKEFELAQIELVEHLNNMKIEVENQLEQNNLSQKQKTIILSIHRKWDGYIVFVDNPHVPMHNNVAENSLRSGAVGRNSYYGSQSEWSGILTTVCMTLFQSAEKNGIMPIKYLEFYFNTCQENGGKPPEDLEMMLPWNAKKYIAESDDMEINSG
jgi:transposase